MATTEAKLRQTWAGHVRHPVGHPVLYGQNVDPCDGHIIVILSCSIVASQLQSCSVLWLKQRRTVQATQVPLVTFV